jgi:hypothetical protein
MEATVDLAPRRCTARNRLGEPCGKTPIPGGSVCAFHGGRAPQTVAAARARLVSMVEPVLSAFESILEDYQATRCPTCNRPTGDVMPVLRLGQLVLDRAGFHPSVTIETAKSSGVEPWARWLTRDEMVEVHEIAERARARMAAGEVPPEYHEPVEADEGVLVDEDPEPIQESTVLIPVGFPTPEDVNG